MSISQFKNGQFISGTDFHYYQNGAFHPLNSISIYRNGKWETLWKALQIVTIQGGLHIVLQEVLEMQGIVNGAAAIINEGTISSSPIGEYAVITGDLSAYSAVTFINKGIVEGYGGLGGAGASWGGSPSKCSVSSPTIPSPTSVGGNGQPGGSAIHVTSPLFIDNQNTIRGGGGGGGGGDGNLYSKLSRAAAAGGGNGGNGAGNQGGASAGSSGKYVDCGGGITTSGGRGGNGGDYGAPGSDGERKSYGVFGYGGAAGKAVVGDSLVTWVNQGTIQGARV